MLKGKKTDLKTIVGPLTLDLVAKQKKGIWATTQGVSNVKKKEQRKEKDGTLIPRQLDKNQDTSFGYPPISET